MRGPALVLACILAWLLLLAGLSHAAPLAPVGSCKWQNFLVDEYIDSGGIVPNIIALTEGEEERHLVYIDWVLYPGGDGTTWHIEHVEDINWECTW